MKVLDLRCDQGHGFEGWFGSEDDYRSQLGRGLVECPLCGSRAVGKLPSAPRLNLSGAREPASTPRPAAVGAAGHAARAGAAGGAAGSAAVTAGADGPSGGDVGHPRGGVPGPVGAQVPHDGPAPAAMAAALQAAWMQAVQQVLKNTEDVGERFPEEARRIHYGEVPQRGIRGVATPEQRAALADEGVEVMALPIPAALKGPVQ